MKQMQTGMLTQRRKGAKTRGTSIIFAPWRLRDFALNAGLRFLFPATHPCQSATSVVNPSVSGSSAPSVPLWCTPIPTKMILTTDNTDFTEKAGSRILKMNHRGTESTEMKPDTDQDNRRDTGSAENGILTTDGTDSTDGVSSGETKMSYGIHKSKIANQKSKIASASVPSVPLWLYPVRVPTEN